MMGNPVIIRPSGAGPAPPISNARLGITLFIVSEIMLFATILGGYVVLRMASGNFQGMGHMPPGLMWLSTALLAFSSVTLIVAVRGIDNPVRVRTFLVVTLAIGAVFLGLQFTEWQRLINVGITPALAVNSGMFYLLSGLHGLHVAGGLVILLVAVVKAYRGNITPVKRAMMDVAGAYWHFVTLVWVALFVLLFLV